MGGLAQLHIAGRTESTARLLTLEGAEPARSLYIHVPFCFHKCHYCDFYSFVDTRGQQDRFVAALRTELGALARHARGSGAAPLRSIFVGGGTPSLLRPDLWEALLRDLERLFELSEIRSGAGEFTVECNPETVTPALMGTLASGGVNRASIGAQSFVPRHLETLERWHDPANVERAVEMAREAGIPRRSIDLIFAIPGQTLREWERDLDDALALAGGVGAGIEHISCYALTYEPNTPMTKRRDRGDFAAVEDEVETAMYEACVRRLAEAGLARYEVSNFALPGAESRHNLAYWRCEPWYAAGPSASGHLGGHRWKNVPRIGSWLEGVERSGGFSPIVDHETPDDRRALAETLMMGLRTAEGVSARRIWALCGENSLLKEHVTRRCDTLVREGLLEAGADRWRPTARGFLFADWMAGEFLDAIEQVANEKAPGSMPGAR